MEGTKSAFADSPEIDLKRNSGVPLPARGALQSAEADFVLFLPRFQPTALRGDETAAVELGEPVLIGRGPRSARVEKLRAIRCRSREAAARRASTSSRRRREEEAHAAV
jgi:hypothetical protein